MMTEEQLREYFEDFRRNHNRLPIILKLDENMILKNAQNTANFYPWKWGKNGSWKDYWRAFANCRGDNFKLAEMPNTCPNIPSCYNINFDIANEVNSHDRDIIGAHVEIYYDLDDNREENLYIIPLCTACNSRHGELLKYIPLGTIMVEMMDHIILE